jgi:biopolymer transport protein ExbB
MSPLLELIRKGGPAMFAIIVLSVVLYSRCFKLLFSLRAAGGPLPSSGTASTLPASEAIERQREIRDTFRHQRIALVAMIAAAPLLGLLGTVNGMTKTFESLSGKAADKSMEGLARGISEVLVATESGLMVALPALLLVWLAHREMLRRVRQLNPVVRRATTAVR